MKIFISWSGDRSHKVAELLNNWIQCVIQAVDPWLSSKDIDRGSLWFTEITNELANTHNGIVCLTKSNLNKPWILFESGALAKGLSSNRVFTFLIDCKPSDISDPLAQFNHTLPGKQGLYQLVRTINIGLGNNALKENILSDVFDTYFPQFESKFKKIIKETKDEPSPEPRKEKDLLVEILNSIRRTDRRMRDLEEKTKGVDYFSTWRPHLSDNLKTKTDSTIELNYKARIYEYVKDGLSDENIIESLPLKPASWICDQIDITKKLLIN